MTDSLVNLVTEDARVDHKPFALQKYHVFLLLRWKTTKNKQKYLHLVTSFKRNHLSSECETHWKESFYTNTSTTVVIKKGRKNCLFPLYRMKVSKIFIFCCKLKLYSRIVLV